MRHKRKYFKGKYYQEHRLVVEQSFGRYLLKSEVVHHINGDKRDNRIENLQVMTDLEHRKHHLKDENRQRVISNLIKASVPFKKGFDARRNMDGPKKLAYRS